MKLKLIRLFILSVLILISVKSIAQEKDLLSPPDEYKAEIGITGGGAYYLGDANSLLFNNMQLAYGGFFRYRFDTRLAAKIELSNAKFAVNGAVKMVSAVDINGEFNFFDLEKNAYKRYSKTFSPYFFAGLGMMTGISKGQTWPEYTIPFGVGLKVKLATRWNLNVQWSNRLLLADDLEGTTSPSPLNNQNGLNGNNPFNNDLLSTLTVGISFDIWKKHCECENSAVQNDRHNFKK